MIMPPIENVKECAHWAMRFPQCLSLLADRFDLLPRSPSSAMLLSPCQTEREGEDKAESGLYLAS